MWYLSTPLRAFTLSVVSITTFSFQVLVRRKSYIFPFFDSTSTFFLTVNGSVFWGAPSQDWTWLFFLPLYYVLDAFLKKRMAPLHCFLDAFLKKCMALTTWQSEVKPSWMQSINFYIRVTVIESWWKIKFNEQKKNSSACFYSLNQHYLT